MTTGRSEVGKSGGLLVIFPFPTSIVQISCSFSPLSTSPVSPPGPPHRKISQPRIAGRLARPPTALVIIYNTHHPPVYLPTSAAVVTAALPTPSCTAPDPVHRCHRECPRICFTNAPSSTSLPKHTFLLSVFVFL
jgi:hypothetical protein